MSGSIVEVAESAIQRLAASSGSSSEVRSQSEDDDALARRVLRSIATSETIRSNCRAAMSRPADIDEAEERAMLERAQRLLERVIGHKRVRPSTWN